MNMRLGALLPRAVLVALVWVLGTAAFTLAADRKLVGPSHSPAGAATVQTPDLVVPSVTGQAFVFAKGMLEDAGFAWRVKGSVQGYAGNQVIAQSPAAGTKVVDNGAPTVELRLVKGSYPQNGVPEDTSSYAGTSLELAGAPPVRHVTHVKPARKVVKPARKVVHHKPKARKPVKKHAKPAARPPAFHRPGAPKEPLDEIPLPERADRLAAWVAKGPKATDKNIGHWLYQHDWIVTGAQFGWWHGAQALRRLIAVDREVQRLWGIGHKSERVARRALRRVERKSR
jgi:PASTA domain-containing protein